MLGGGDLKPALLAHCVKLGLNVAESAPWEVGENFRCSILNDECDQRSVYFPGFRQIEELPRFYAYAGAFVHASTTEQWGLVVNEAMASGLPVVVSNRVGCAMNLVNEGENGFTFDPLDVEALAKLLSKMTAMTKPERQVMGEASRGIIAEWGPERFASGLKAAVEAALEVGPVEISTVQKILLNLLSRR